MLSHLYTLHHLATALNPFLEGKAIASIYSQEKNQLCIVLTGGDDEATLVISCEPSLSYIFCRKGSGRARKNSVDIFPSLEGSAIREFSCRDFDRIIDISLNNEHRLEILFFGPKANVLHYRGSVLEDAFLRKKEILAGEEIIGYKKGNSISEPDTVAYMDRIRALPPETQLSRAVKSIRPDFGATLAAETLVRCGADGSEIVGRCLDRDLEKIFQTTRTLLLSLQQTGTLVKPLIYYDREDAPVCFSLLPLQSMEKYRSESYADVNEGIQRFISRKLRSVSLLKKQETLLSHLQKEEKKTEQALRRVTRDLEESSRADDYERTGKILMAQLPMLTKGMKNFEYQGLQIVLEPSLTPIQNAERYFGKAKKARTAQDEQRDRTSELGETLALLRTLAEEASELPSSEAIAQFEKAREKELARFGIAQSAGAKELPPFRIFTVDGGFQVLAGKSSENNDLLTLKYAKPDDLWFHARGSSGSHVVLKTGSAKGEPSKKAVLQAASIAAYYSKMKNASMIPVAMTEKKFVRKPRGVPAGTVVIEREKVLFVEAELPTES
jgi:predicted ribosome quality control (RQC) complex YloA/Tae2 family protein